MNIFTSRNCKLLPTFSEAVVMLVSELELAMPFWLAGRLGVLVLVLVLVHAPFIHKLASYFFFNRSNRS